MKYTSGWTLIELVLTISLMAIVSVMIFKVSYNPDTFNHFRFGQQLIDSVHRAKMFNIYANSNVLLEVHSNTFEFTQLTKDNEETTHHWTVAAPKDLEINDDLFPVILGEKTEQIIIPITTLYHIIMIEPRTVYAYKIPKAQ